jgi:hypothetical protein
MFATERAFLQSWSGYRRCLEEIKNRATLYKTYVKERTAGSGALLASKWRQRS